MEFNIILILSIYLIAFFGSRMLSLYFFTQKHTLIFGLFIIVAAALILVGINIASLLLMCIGSFLLGFLFAQLGSINFKQ